MERIAIIQIGNNITITDDYNKFMENILLNTKHNVLRAMICDCTDEFIDHCSQLKSQELFEILEQCFGQGDGLNYEMYSN